ncbi:unnamed protein product, partial [Symbiodinium sp. CCMP2456]
KRSRQQRRLCGATPQSRFLASAGACSRIWTSRAIRSSAPPATGAEGTFGGPTAQAQGAPERRQLTPPLVGCMKQLRRARSSRHGHHLALPRPLPAGA